jgi:hypothetical protein
MHIVVLTYVSLLFFQASHNSYQNLNHISLCMMSLLILMVWQCATLHCTALHCTAHCHTIKTNKLIINSKGE